VIARTMDEGESGIYRADLADILGAIPVLTDLRLTLYDEKTGTIINGRDHQSVLNANDVTYDPATGRVTWEIRTADNALVDSTRPSETHIAQFVATYNAAPARQKPWQVVIWTRNLVKV